MTGIEISLAWPVDTSGRISQYFGENPAIYKSFNLAGHNGIDFAVPMGSPVMAAARGMVIEVGLDPSGYGNYVKIDHGLSQTLYAHLNNYIVKANNYVNKGQLIGYSNNTGFSTGPHLHFELRVPRHGTPGYKDAVDPLPFLNGSQVFYSYDSPGGEDLIIEGNAVDDFINNDLVEHSICLGTVNVRKLYIRKSPAVTYPSAGWLPKGITVFIHELIQKDGNTWARVGDNLFIAYQFKGVAYLILEK